jgi:hypothetical protein
MARTWLSISVELVEGRGMTLWPRPGRLFAAGRSHTFAVLAEAIDTAFARWDRAHLHLFELADGTQMTGPVPWDPSPQGAIASSAVRLSRLAPGEEFVYVFDMGDDWAHLVRVGTRRIDPIEELGVVPRGPLSCFGWGDIPDQYGRRFAEDDGEGAVPPDPGYRDLPPLRPHWGTSLGGRNG